MLGQVATAGEQARRLPELEGSLKERIRFGRLGLISNGHLTSTDRDVL